MPFLLYLLALAVFAQGTSEFVLAGLLPGIATDFDVSLGRAGLLTSAFAVGMVVGAPVMAVGARTVSPRWALTGFLAAFVVAHLVGALTESFTVLLLTRIGAAVANAGFLAVALSTITRIVPAAKRTRALAVILGGTTLALIAGVPLGALVGAALGWRATLGAIGIICLPALVAVLVATPSASPSMPGRGAPRPLRAEVATLHRAPLQVVVVLAVLVNAATFCTFTYLAVIAGAAGIGGGGVPALLVLFGIGAFIGVSVVGRYGDEHGRSLITRACPLLLAGWTVLALGPGHPVLLWTLTLVQGALSFTLGSTLIARIMVEARRAPAMSGSFATVALNLGAVIGPVAGGIALDAAGSPGIPATSAALVGLALVLWWATGGGKGQE